MGRAPRDAVIDGDVTRGSLMAGQPVGLVNRIQPLKEIIDEMVSEAESELERLKSIFNRTAVRVQFEPAKRELDDIMNLKTFFNFNYIYTGVQHSCNHTQSLRDGLRHGNCNKLNKPCSSIQY